MAFSQEEGEDLYQQVPNSASVQTMSDSEVTSWINRLIGSFGGCITEASKRNLLQKYLQKQKDIASIQPPPMSSTVDYMSFEEVSTLLLNQIGTFAECRDEQSQRNLLKTYLLNKELKGQGELRDYTHIRSSDPLDYEVEHGSYVLDECSKMGGGDYKHQKSKDTCEDEVEHGSDVLYEVSKMTNRDDVLRPEATVVDNMTYKDVGTIMDDLNMNITRSSQDDAHNLKMHLFSGERIDYTQEMRSMVNTTMQKYNEIKQKLVECYSDVIAIVQNESFKKEMSEATEVRFPHYEEKLCSTKTMLQDMTSEFDIIIVGETSAGKSTFLNVLLGESILPKAHSHTTACLCRLHNSVNRMINYEAENGTVRITLKDSSELRERLNSINKKLLSNDQDDNPLKTIDLYWPLSSLHENVVLVDTPGIGERDTLTKQVAQYVPTSAGYIFIVDSSRAGGVQDSGIKILIEAIVGSNSGEEQSKDLSNVLFVCNKWDLVPKEERKIVLEITQRKLSRCWGQLEDWQIVQFNAKLELQLQEWKANPTKDIKVLFKSLETLMTRTIEKRLGDNYRWLHTFVKDVLGFFNAKMNTESKSKEKIKAGIQEARKQLKLATSQVEKINNVKIMIDEEEEQLLKALQNYLEEETKSEISVSVLNLGEMNRKGPALIKAWLQDAILKWATADTGSLKEASNRIAHACSEIQDNIGTIFRSIEEHELGFNLQDATAPIINKTSQDYALFRTSVFSSYFCTLAAINSPRIIPLAAVSYILLYLNLKNLRDLISSKLATIVSKLLSKDHLRKIIIALFSCPRRNCLTKWQEDTQCRIASTYTMLQGMEQDKQINSDTRCMLQSFQAKFKKCLECLEELKK